MQVEQLSLLVHYMKPAEKKNSLAQNSHHNSGPNQGKKNATENEEHVW